MPKSRRYASDNEPSARRWVFTINNPGISPTVDQHPLDPEWEIKCWDHHASILLAHAQPPKGTCLLSTPLGELKFVSIALESGEQKGTKHFQGYFICKRNRTLRFLKKLKGFARAHFEIMAGSIADNDTYLAKDKDKDFYRIYNCGNKPTDGEARTPGWVENFLSQIS